MEMLIGKLRQELENNSSSSIFLKKTVTVIVPWPPYFPPLHLTDGEEFHQPILCLLQLLKKKSQVSEAGIAIRCCSIPGSLYTAWLSSLAVNDRTWAFE